MPRLLNSNSWYNFLSAVSEFLSKSHRVWSRSKNRCLYGLPIVVVSRKLLVVRFKGNKEQHAKLDNAQLLFLTEKIFQFPTHLLAAFLQVFEFLFHIAGYVIEGHGAVAGHAVEFLPAARGGYYRPGYNVG